MSKLFRKFIEKLHVSLKSDKNNWYFRRRRLHIYKQYLTEILLEWEMLWTNVVEKLKTHVLGLVNFSENRAVNQIMSKNIAKPERPQMTQYGAYALHAG